MSTFSPAAPPESSLVIGPSALLRGKIRALRKTYVTVAMMTGLAILVVLNIELVALAMFLDWWLELPWMIRLLSLVVQAGVFSVILLRYVLRPVLCLPGDEELALLVERARPEFRSRLIASMQLVQPGAVPDGASSSLVSALVDETESLARPLDFRDIVATERLKKFGTMAVVVPLIAMAGFIAGRDTCTVLVKRVFLSDTPVPRKTHVVVPEGNRRIGIGDTVRLDAFVQGLIPRHGKVEVRYRSRRSQEFPLEQNRDNRAHFLRTLENVQDSFSYRFSLGDGVSQFYEVTAVPRPTVASIECEQEFPAYTGLKPMRRVLGDLSLLAGSTLKLQVIATKDLQSANLKLVGMEREIPLNLNVEKPRELTGQFNIPAKGLTGFQVQMLDRDRMESRDSAVYRVDIIPDKPPTARLTYPDRKEELVTRHATMLVGFEATDDFEIRKVRLKYKVDALNNGAEQSVELDLEQQRSQRLRRRHEWSIAALSPTLSEGNVIEFWIEVEDNNDATGPGITSTEHQLARIVSESEKRADLLNRAGDYLGSISDVAADQERLNRSLGQIIRAKTGLR